MAVFYKVIFKTQKLRFAYPCYTVSNYLSVPVQIPVAPQCVTSAFPSTAAHSVMSAALASSKHPGFVFHVTAAGMQTLRAPPSSVTPTPATASTASTTPPGPSASSVLQASSGTPRHITVPVQVRPNHNIVFGQTNDFIT